jgi:hypothetical protein
MSAHFNRIFFFAVLRASLTHCAAGTVTDIAWSPDSQRIVAVGAQPCLPPRVTDLPAPARHSATARGLELHRMPPLLPLGWFLH